MPDLEAGSDFVDRVPKVLIIGSLLTVYSYLKFVMVQSVCNTVVPPRELSFVESLDVVPAHKWCGSRGEG